MSLRFIRLFIEDFLCTSESLRAPRSPLGGQLATLRAGLISQPDEWSRNNAAEEKFSKYAAQLKVWSTLTEEEQNVLILKFTPKAPAEMTDEDYEKSAYTRIVREHELLDHFVPPNDQGGHCLAPLKAGGGARRCLAQRIIGTPRCPVHADVPAEVDHRATRRGEELVPQADIDRLELTPPPEGFVLVRGNQPVYRDYRSIASLLGVSVHNVRTTLTSAYARLEENPLFSLLAQK